MAFGVTGSWEKICLADTENRSALYYAGEKTGPWQHIDFNPSMRDGYHPNNWIKLIEYVEQDSQIECLILDSISHEWEGTGGCLDIINKINKGFAGWQVVTPLHNAFFDKMRHSRLNIIATMRTKSDYVVEQNEKGKAAPKKVGLKSNQREGADYEFGIIFNVEINHFAQASKDRTGLFMGRPPFMITDETGKELLAWSKGGIVQPKAPEVYNETAPQKKAIKQLFDKYEIKDKEFMKTLSNALIGIPMDKLETKIMEQNYVN